MTDKELKKLRRADLLEMMLALSKENEQLRKQLEQANEKLEDREIKVEAAGSLAEAALQLSHIFESAQTACEQYAHNIKLRCAQQARICQQMEKETKAKCDALIAQAQKQAQACLEEADRKARKQNGSHS